MKNIIYAHTAPVICSLSCVFAAQASLTLVGSGNYPSAGNLVVNGSFENGHPGPGGINQRHWAAGTSLTPFLLIPGWTGLGQPGTYAMWGSDQPVGPFTARSSDYLPDGQTGVYFGNGGAQVNLAPAFNPDFSVSFAGNPVFTVFMGGPATLSQTVPTHLNPAPKYGLSFWASGEGALYGNPNDTGLFGLKVSNTLPGDPTLYFQVPPGPGGAIGASHVYRFELVPLNPLLPVTVEFINFGHLDLTPFGGTGTTELVIDDVRLVAVPEPGALALAGGGLVFLLYRLRRRR
jgi:hypothetical protein